MSDALNQQDSAGSHLHDVSCAFGNPTCPAFGEQEVNRRSWWKRLRARIRYVGCTTCGHPLGSPPCYPSPDGRGGHTAPTCITSPGGGRTGEPS